MRSHWRVFPHREDGGNYSFGSPLASDYGQLQVAILHELIPPTLPCKPRNAPWWRNNLSCLQILQAWQRLLIAVIDDNDDIIAISDYYRD